jgi:hypothetical protein
MDEETRRQLRRLQQDTSALKSATIAAPTSLAALSSRMTAAENRLTAVEQRVSALEDGTVVPPVTASEETLARASYLVSGSPFVGATTQPAHEGGLQGIPSYWSWAQGVDFFSATLSTHRLNVWWQVNQKTGTSPVAGSSDWVQVTQYKMVSYNGSWSTQTVGQDTDGGQYIGAPGEIWTVQSGFNTGNGKLRQATEPGGGWCVRYDELNVAGTDVIHGWCLAPSRVPMPTATSAVHVSNWMRLVGPNAVTNSDGRLMAVCTSDLFFADGSSYNGNGIGYPRFTALTSAWQCFSMLGFTEQVAAADRTNAAYHGTWLSSHSDFPKNPQPAS